VDQAFIYLSVPWAVSIHTVTAFLYAGLPGRGFWLTAVMAPRFLTSAFAAGPALLILLALLVRKLTKFDPGKEQIQTLAKIVAYALPLNLFLLGCEIFTVFSGIPTTSCASVPLLRASRLQRARALDVDLGRARGRRRGAARQPDAAQRDDAGLGLRDDVRGDLDRQGPRMISGGFVPNPLENHRVLADAARRADRARDLAIGR
jgi:hypothetical protein